MGKHVTAIALIGFLAGCLGGTQPPPLVRHYSLEYPPPRVEHLPRTEALLKVERFSVDRLYTGPAMLYRKGDFRRDAYHERRWRVNPGDMVMDFLRRDIRQAGLFRAVLAARDREETRFLLEGGVEEFLEVEEGETRKALLVATVTLLDLSFRDAPRRVVFQKTYRSEATFARGESAGLPEAMSRAMSRFSAQVIADLGDALKGTGR